MSDLVTRLCIAIENGKSMDEEDLSSFIQGVASRTLSIEDITMWLQAVHTSPLLEILMIY